MFIQRPLHEIHNTVPRPKDLQLHSCHANVEAQNRADVAMLTVTVSGWAEVRW